MKKTICCLLLFAAAFGQVDPPAWPNHFSEAFVESYNYTDKKISSKMYYDYERNMLRVDRSDGEFEAMCGSVMPNTTTPCT